MAKRPDPYPSGLKAEGRKNYLELAQGFQCVGVSIDPGISMGDHPAGVIDDEYES